MVNGLLLINLVAVDAVKNITSSSRSRQRLILSAAGTNSHVNI